MKTCTACRTYKRASDYHRDKHSSDGRAAVCRECAQVKATVTNKALAALRDRYHDEYMELRRQIAAELQEIN